MTTFNPSTAPRWNRTTSFFLFAAAVVTSARTLRDRNAGIAEVPTSASAPPFMNPRRLTTRRASSRPCMSHPQSLQSTILFLIAIYLLQSCYPAKITVLPNLLIQTHLQPGSCLHLPIPHLGFL